MVIIPDYFCGKMINPMTSPREEVMEVVQNVTQWDETLKVDWEEKIQPYALKHGATTFGAIGES
jgi:hypothetical protein